MSRKEQTDKGTIHRSAYKRGRGPNCANPDVRCNHAIPFHGGEQVKGKCSALGCRCTGWVSPAGWVEPDEADDPVAAAAG